MKTQAGGGLELSLSIPDELLTALAERVASLALKRGESATEAASPWLDAGAAAAYIGIPRGQLYKLTAANAIPVRKRRRGQGLRFRREELDAWIEAEYEATGWMPKIELSSSDDT
jgi:excisionase family DNA binding protein